MSFAELGLIPELQRAVTEAGYTEPTPIQKQAIPVVLQGLDVMGGAQTGTGKTAGFTLPLIQRLARHANTSTSPARHPVRALILAPTRELAVQVHESVQTYCKYVPLRSICVYGGVDMRGQVDELRRGVEIVVATPGRLLDHVQQKTIAFNQVEMLVLDEADRMLDMGFIPDIRRILDMLPEARQSLLFSATFSDEIKKLADRMLKNPQLIEVARRNTVSETITHTVHPVSAGLKRNLLAHLLRHAPDTQSLIFVSTKVLCGRLASFLARHGIAADAIHGDKSQVQRSETLEAFKAGKLRVLVATDVAARGLDIDDLPMVINYELPHTAEDYVHRIGRTGRAGRQGHAVSLVCAEEKPRLAEIEKLIKFQIPQQDVPGFAAEPDYDIAGSSRSKRERAGAGKSDQEPSRNSTTRPKRSDKPARGRSNPGIAPDGFDFSKPYESTVAGTPLGETPENAVIAPSEPRPSRARPRPVAVLLGGLGRK
ncbi:DEAD/DEAH box helicase [Azoarcus taiwanensis]|uniref:DEAD-box ATP-dependent RNA helicase RhpA n=1 Tax=Azoarcus taiwanensis TaxID=666964 RepID=A0A972F9Q4_9RHOO|nr:DEAD/DEAH box helicase [Azoarcus taiwanensis]NMG04797.1 DEAD/DEAH box helicase [Azoarcus taiwanensis]